MMMVMMSTEGCASRDTMSEGERELIAGVDEGFPDDGSISGVSWLS